MSSLDQQFLHNSVYIGGSPTAGSGRVLCFQRKTDGQPRSFRDNISSMPTVTAARRVRTMPSSRRHDRQSGRLDHQQQRLPRQWPRWGSSGSTTRRRRQPGGVANGGRTGSGKLRGQTRSISTRRMRRRTCTSTRVVTTVIESNGVDVGVTDDFDGQTRATLTPVDIGADAGNFTRHRPRARRPLPTRPWATPA